MTCREAIEQLAEYLDAELTAAAFQQIDAHLESCAPCRAYAATYRKTTELVAKVGRVELPEDVKTLVRALVVSHIAYTRRIQ
jgi:anti-sigma factor RsiW